MTTCTTEKRWHSGVTAGGQGSVACLDTGRTIALTYDPDDAPLLAAAPGLLSALRQCEERLLELKRSRGVWGDDFRAWENARAAIEKATNP